MNRRQRRAVEPPRWAFNAVTVTHRPGCRVSSSTSQGMWGQWIMELAEKLGWPADVDCGDGVVVPGGAEAAWYAWVGAAPESADDRTLRVAWDVLAAVWRERGAGVDIGPPSGWGGMVRRKAEREAEDRAERERRFAIEARGRAAEEQAGLLARLAALGWPRLHVRVRSGSYVVVGQWVKGEEAWRDLFDDGLADQYGIWRAVEEHEMSQPARVATKGLAPDTADGLALTARAVAQGCHNGGAAHEHVVAGWIALDLGMKSKFGAPKGRVLKFIEAAVAAGHIEACTMPGGAVGYRRAAPPPSEREWALKDRAASEQPRTATNSGGQ